MEAREEEPGPVREDSLALEIILTQRHAILRLAGVSNYQYDY